MNYPPVDFAPGTVLDKMHTKNNDNNSSIVRMRRLAVRIVARY